MSELRQAAQAVVDRWDTPLWKDAPRTAEFIDRLRAALARSGQAASGSSQGARSDEHVRRLQDAIEGECDGLAIDEHHARAILEYVLGGVGQPEAPTAAPLVRDAARYRFLRDNDKRHFWPPVHGSMWVVIYHQPPGAHVMPETRGAGYGAELDATVDAAMALARSGAGSDDRKDESWK